ncbi:M17 family metallopeptidase [Mycoplasmopsis cynos]|nr:M17 family metallopeptidase [Mycoplasmopsis cynos]UWV92621.1 M17 family metallopeptidase [Mycoplasmopsis cynos]
MLASEIVNDFSGIDGLKVEVLTKKEIKDLNMGLLLSVNKGSTHEPRVVIISYRGDKKSKEHTSIVGKGITFDTGGVNTKGYYMDGMKFDMSGSVVAAYTVKTLAELKAKVNVSAIMCITDNRINADASLPENVYQSMSGKWVEVVDTDRWRSFGISWWNILCSWQIKCNNNCRCRNFNWVYFNLVI